MFIIYGTAYYGKDNLHSQEGECRQCGKQGDLQYYDSIKYFTLFWIPIIPLGKKRILEACPHCKRHFESGMGKYKENKKSSLEEIYGQMRQHPNDEQIVIEYIYTLFSFSMYNEFITIADDLAKKFSTNAQVMTVLAQQCFFLGLYEQAVRYGREAYGLNKTEETGDVLYDATICLVYSYYNRKKYQEGVNQINEYLKVKPEDSHDETFKTLIQQGSAAGGYRKVPLKPIIDTTKKGLPTIFPLSIPVLLLLTIITLIGVSGFNESYKSDIYLVNGTPEAYSVSINEKDYYLPEYGTKKISVYSKTISVTGDNSLINLKQDEFFLPKGSSNTLIFNPDRQALLVKEKTIYAATFIPSQVADPFEFFIGGNLYTLPEIDFIFKEFPKELNLDSSTSQKTVFRVFNIPPQFPGHLAQVLISYQVDKAMVIDYLEAYLPANSDDRMSLASYISLAADDASKERVRSFLERGLVNPESSIEWHRIYQYFMERNFQDADIYTTYLDIYNKDPGNHTNAYLLARIEQDPQKALKLFQFSEEGEKPIGYGYNGISYQYMCQGDYEKAYPYALQAYNISNEKFYDSIDFLSEALAKYDFLVAEAKKIWLEDTNNYQNTYNYLRALWMAGQEDEAEKVRSSFIKTLDIGSITTIGGYFDYLENYLKGDLKTSIESMESFLDSQDNYYDYHLLNRDAQEFKKLFDDSIYDNSVNAAILYILARYRNKQDIADFALKKLISHLEQDDIEHRKVYAMLKGSKKVRFSDIRQMMIVPEHKRLYVTVLGLVYPEIKTECFALARKMNKTKKVPYWLIQEITGR